MVEVIEDVKTIRCAKNDLGLFECEINTPRGRNEYTLEGLVFNNSSGKSIVVKEDSFFDFTARKGSRIKYYPENKRMVIDTGEE